MNTLQKAGVIITSLLVALNSAGSATAATFVNLNTATNFAIIAGSTITNTGSSIIQGDVGLSPGTSITGFPPGNITGTQHIADAAAAQAKLDLVTAYNAALGQAATTTATELGGTIKTPGTYTSAGGTFALTGTLTLDAQGDPNAIFIFKTNSTLTTAGASTIVLANNAQACNVFWQVGSSATLGTNSTFKGTIMALTSVTVTTGAQVDGRVLARNGAVTLDINAVVRPACLVATPTPTPTATPTVTPTPSITPTVTPTPSVTPSPSATPTPTTTPSPSVTPTPSVTPSATPTVTITSTPSTTPSTTPVPQLPNTGTPPDAQHTPAGVFVMAGLLVAAIAWSATRKIGTS
ncbi:MAG: ice-binding family protein [Patescibacteria group bacterium]